MSIIPWEGISDNILVIYVKEDNGGQAGRSHQIFPSIYLKNNVIIESGTGTNTDPYKLQIES